MKKKSVSGEIFRFYKPDGSFIEECWTSEDYELGRVIARLRFGVLGVYWTSGFKRFFLPYEDIDNAFLQMEQSAAKLSGGVSAYETTYVVVCREGAELARLLVESESQANTVIDLLKSKNEDIIIGYRD